MHIECFQLPLNIVREMFFMTPFNTALSNISYKIETSRNFKD